jgi:hypothetical protein
VNTPLVIYLKHIPDRKCDRNIDIDPNNSANDSRKRTLLEQETHKGLYETRKITKYTTQESDVFMEKDIPREILSRDKPRSRSHTSFFIRNKLPYIGVSDSGHAEDRFPTRLISTPNRHAG